MLKSLNRFLFFYLYAYPQNNNPFSVISKLFLYGNDQKGKYFSSEINTSFGLNPVFYFTDDEHYNLNKLIESCPSFIEFYKSDVLPKINTLYPCLLNADLNQSHFWAEQIKSLIELKINDSTMVSFAKNSPYSYSMAFPNSDNEISLDGTYFFSVYNRYNHSPDLTQESILMDFVKMFFSTMVSTYQEEINNSFKIPPNLKNILNERIYNFGVFHSNIFSLPLPIHSPSKPFKALYYSRHRTATALG